MEYFVISAKFVPLKYYTLSSQLRRLTSFSVGLFGSANSVTRSYPVMRKSCIAWLSMIPSWPTVGFTVTDFHFWNERYLYHERFDFYVIMLGLANLSSSGLARINTRNGCCNRGGSRYGPNRHRPPLLTAKSCKFSRFWGYISYSAPLYRHSAPSFYKSWIRPCARKGR